MKLGCVGLGRLGFAVAANLIEAGFEVTGFRRRSLDGFVAIGGRPARSAAQVIAASEIVVTCLPATSLRDVVAGEQGLLAGAAAGQIVIDITTAPLELKHELRARLAAAGVAMLDCPISGRPNVVRTKRAPIFVSGDEAAVARCRPVLEAISARPQYLGAFGEGSKMKYIANLLLAIHVMAAAEALEIGRRAGFTPQGIADALASSAAASAQLQIRAPVIAGDASQGPRDAPRNFHTDMRIIREFVGDLGCAAPLFETALEYFEQAEAAGYGDRDSALMFTAILRRIAGAPRRP